jgi:hypothetical protein
MDEAGDNLGEAGDNMGETGDNRGEAGDNMGEAGDNMGEAGDNMTSGIIYLILKVNFKLAYLANSRKRWREKKT